MKNIVVFGAGGFIGGHLCNKLKKLGYWVRGVDIKNHEFNNCECDEFLKLDLRYLENVRKALNHYEKIDEVYQLAADMGGAEYIFTGENDLNIMHNSSLINLNLVTITLEKNNVGKIFYSSSACIYPEENQLDPDNPNCEESSAYPAHPDSEYGWEKLFSERLFLSLQRNYGIPVRIARYHNIFGPYGTWCGGKEKAPAAICRKIASTNNNEIEIFGNGLQTRSFLYIDECIEGTLKLMESNFSGPVNIGSEEMVTINQLVDYISKIANKNIKIKHINGPLGVNGRNSHNKLIKEKLNWEPTLKLNYGLEKLYQWIYQQIHK
jgi:nucleoside-diphosphate-sugar epimerase